MAEVKIDYKKRDKELYLPGQKPIAVTVPAMQFITIDGIGAPGDEAFHEAIQALYSLSYAIKMSKMSGEQPKGYFEYVVPPLEGLWWMGDGREFDTTKRDEWHWRLMIRQPEFVTKSVLEWAKKRCKTKNSELTLIEEAQLISFDERLCVQAMHIGDYSTEHSTIDKIMQFISYNGMVADMGETRKHHEIYMSDPRKTAPDKIKTVLRIPVKMG